MAQMGVKLSALSPTACYPATHFLLLLLLLVVVVVVVSSSSSDFFFN
jgi:hypothetical protein